jgi:hypothetical protein
LYVIFYIGAKKAGATPAKGKQEPAKPKEKVWTKQDELSVIIYNVFYSL